MSWEEIKIFFWRDSMTVLAWISREENFTVFIRNRVQEIRNLSDPSLWKHIPGEIIQQIYLEAVKQTIGIFQMVGGPNLA